MRWVRALFDNEAVLAVAIIEALAVLGVAFGFDLGPETVAALVALVVPIGAIVQRMFVYSADTVATVKEHARADGAAAQRQAHIDGPATPDA